MKDYLQVSKTAALIVLCMAVLTGCGGKSPAEQACDAYLQGEMSKIVPAFAALVRENPSYGTYLSAAEKYVYFQNELMFLENSYDRSGRMGFSFIGVEGSIEEAQRILDPFCAS